MSYSSQFPSFHDLIEEKLDHRMAPYQDGPGPGLRETVALVLIQGQERLLVQAVPLSIRGSSIITAPLVEHLFSLGFHLDQYQLYYSFGPSAIYLGHISYSQLLHNLENMPISAVEHTILGPTLTLTAEEMMGSSQAMPEVSYSRMMEEDRETQNTELEPWEEDRTDTMPQKRQKERLIKEVLEGVALWRYYYDGFLSPSGRYQKLSLDEAARLLSFNKKTLDDYILQIRKATFYGFDFKANQDKKMGVLRKFNHEKGKEQGGNKLRFKDIHLQLDEYLPGHLQDILIN